MSNQQRVLWVTLLLLTAIAAGCLGGSDDPPAGGDGDGDDPGGGDFDGNGTNDPGAGDGNQTGDQDDGNTTTPGDDGSDGNGTTDDDADGPEDYNASYNGSVQPGFAESWEFPVASSSPTGIVVEFNVTGDPLPQAPAHINLTLTNATGDVVRSENVTSGGPMAITWSVTGDAAAVEGTWTLAAEGVGLGAEDMGARYQVHIAVTY